MLLKGYGAVRLHLRHLASEGKVAAVADNGGHTVFIAAPLNGTIGGESYGHFVP